MQLSMLLLLLLLQMMPMTLACWEFSQRHRVRRAPAQMTDDHLSVVEHVISSRNKL